MRACVRDPMHFTGAVVSRDTKLRSPALLGVLGEVIPHTPEPSRRMTRETVLTTLTHPDS